MKKKLLVFVIAFALCTMTLLPMMGGEVNVVAMGTEGAQGQDRPMGKILNSYRQGSGGVPEWVSSAFALSLTKLQGQQGRDLGVTNPATELRLFSADQDDLGMTHVRMDQVQNGVPVLGGQVISHHYANGDHWANGRIFEDARGVNVRPKISPEAAIELAKAALNRKSGFAREPVAELVILPNAIKNESEDRGASLTYKVELLINTDREAGRFFYFVNAHNGKIEWSYDSLENGTGNSQYSGTVNIGTFFTNTFEMNDRTRSGGNLCGSKPGIITSDFQVSNGNTCSPFTDADDIWGNGNLSNRQTAGVDAHFGASKYYDYLLSRFNRQSINGSNYQLACRTFNNGAGVDNAFWDGSVTNYGSGSQGRSWATVDVVGHEFTHGLTQFTSNLIYANQSGGLNESYSDIFGTMLEYYIGINPDYLIGEDVVPGGLRTMVNPKLDGHSIDHISGYVNGMDPHYSSGLQNVAFYLVAEGGNHPTTQVPVKKIGRSNAEQIFFRALTLYLFQSATFADARAACEHATIDLLQPGNPIYFAVQKAWFSTGVGANVSLLSIDDPQEFVKQHYRDFLLREADPSGLAFWTGQITQCGNDAACEDAKRVDVSLSFFYSAEFQQQARAAGLPNPNPPPDFNNQKFVELCYLTYLQRQPDAGGLAFWTNILNSNNNYRGIVRAFLVSTEYRARFSGGPQGCNPQDQINCENNGGIWNPNNCTCFFDPGGGCKQGEIPVKGEDPNVPPQCRPIMLVGGK